MLLALRSLNMIYHDISFHVETVALIIQGKYVSNEVKTEKNLRVIVLKSIEKLCIVAYTITSGIVMWKERMKIWLNTKKTI